MRPAAPGATLSSRGGSVSAEDAVGASTGSASHWWVRERVARLWLAVAPRRRWVQAFVVLFALTCGVLTFWTPGILEDPITSPSYLTEIHVADADGSGLERLTTNAVGDDDPTRRPDGRIAFESNRAGPNDLTNTTRFRYTR